MWQRCDWSLINTWLNRKRFWVCPQTWWELLFFFMHICSLVKLALVENPISSFLEDEKLYENEVCLEVILQIIKLIFSNGIIYLNIFGRKIFTPACLVSAITKWMTFYLEVFKHIISLLGRISISGSFKHWRRISVKFVMYIWINCKPYKIFIFLNEMRRNCRF